MPIPRVKPAARILPTGPRIRSRQQAKKKKKKKGPVKGLLGPIIRRPKPGSRIEVDA